MVENILRNEKKAQTIIATKIKGNTLESAAQSSGTTIQHADSLSFQSPAVMGVGLEPKVVGAAFNKQLLNKPSSPIAGNGGVFIVKERRGIGYFLRGKHFRTNRNYAKKYAIAAAKQQYAGVAPQVSHH